MSNVITHTFKIDGEGERELEVDILDNKGVYITAWGQIYTDDRDNRQVQEETWVEINPENARSLVNLLTDWLGE